MATTDDASANATDASDAISNVSWDGHGHGHGHAAAAHARNSRQEKEKDDEDDSIDTKKFSTPELFRNYGIIEEYPQLYHFDLEEEQYGEILSIQIDKKKIVGSK